MQGFKKSPLTLWLEHYGYNRVADVVTSQSVSSQISDDGNKKESLSDSQSSNLNDTICCDTNEESLPSNDGSGGSLYPDDLASVNYPEFFSDITYTDESASQSLYGAVSDSTSLYKSNSSNEFTKESLSQIESESIRGKGAASELTLSSELKTVCSTVSTSALIASSDATSEIQEENINKYKLDQVSKFCDDDDEGIDIHKSYCTTITKIVHYLVSSVTFRIFGILLIFLDIFLMAIDLHLYNSNFYIPLGYRSLSFAIALFFLVDVLLRVYVEGRQNYFSDLLNTLDAVVIGVTLLIALTYILYDKKFLRDIPRLAVLFRPLRLLILIRILQLAHQKRHLEKLTRQLVSKNKRRFKKDGFDLDLTYVTDRIIAMSFPSSGGQSFYRNPIDTVLLRRHMTNKYVEHGQHTNYQGTASKSHN